MASVSEAEPVATPSQFTAAPRGLRMTPPPIRSHTTECVPARTTFLARAGPGRTQKTRLTFFFASRRMFVQFILLAVNTLTSPSLSPSFRLSRVHPKRRIHFYRYKQTSSFSLFTNLMRVCFSLSRGRGEGGGTFHLRAHRDMQGQTFRPRF